MILAGRLTEQITITHAGTTRGDDGSLLPGRVEIRRAELLRRSVVDKVAGKRLAAVATVAFRLRYFAVATTAALSWQGQSYEIVTVEHDKRAGETRIFAKAKQ